MKLTRRQEMFLRKMLDLYHEARKPLHYSELAERVGVSRFTAYDMLRLLEEKGLVTSDYQLAADKTGPGRSEIVFMPTETTRRLLAELGGDVDGEDWESWRERFLAQVARQEVVEKDLIDELLARIPHEETEPLRYCSEVIGVIVLRLQRAAGRRQLMEFMPLIMPAVDRADPQSWGLLGGLALGILIRENADDHAWCREMLEHVQRCGALVNEMSPEQLRRLSGMVNDIYASFQEENMAQ